METVILETIIDAIDSTERCVLVTPIERSGSVPCPDHSSLVLTVNRTVGTVGGGLLEARAMDIARKVLKSGKPEYDTERLDADQAAENGMLCGGSVSFLFEPLHIEKAGCWKEARHAAEHRVEGAFIVDLPDRNPERKFRRWVRERNIDRLEIGDKDVIRDAIHDGRRETILTNDRIRFIDPLVLSDDLLVFGGGHVAHALVPVAVAIGFRVWVIDDRESFVSEDRFPAAYKRLVGDPAETVNELPHGSHVYAVIMTRGHKDDQRIVERLLGNTYRYIGMIGSHRKKEAIWAELRSRGTDQNRLNEISCPIGLPVGGTTPAEIAVSIASELLAVRYGKKGDISIPL